ncbi:MAG: fatty acid oxidation complex subunit alpha FadJ [Gemmatimonadetes bacterium]|nr:fatty acid oxidation complex subunit alpha FadJ [Gemmatimonadota bacterium]MYE15540.1 fatty acid oxidation complex subunit alpha FadJ [Gemmatimonadota bacterium]
MNPRPEPATGSSSEGLLFEIDPGGIGLATFDDPARGQNVLTLEVMRTLEDVVTEAEAAAADGSLRAVLFRSAKPGSFIAGADVNAIAAVDDPAEGTEAARQGQTLFGRIAALPVPTVAAIRGICLGGGTELALSCDYRVADDGDRTRIGLPEVLLGILPAWGGTTRLPRLVGLSAALDLMLTGKPARVSKARRIGLIDRVLPREQFEEQCLALVRRLARGEGLPPTRKGRRRTLVGRLLDGTPPGRALVLRAAAKQVRKRTGGRYPAPLRILDVARKGVRGPVAATLEHEARAAGDLITSPECKNLLFVFQLREHARKAPWAQGGRAKPVVRMAVLGAGPMGGGIAQVAAYNGIRVRMKDIRHEAVAGGLAHARSVFDGAVRRRSLRKRDADARMGLISGGVDYAGVGSADLVVEAVVERMAVKRAVLREVEGVVGPEAVIATNTSSLSVDEMAAALERPERFAGMHFFNPVHRMPLVEVVKGAATDADTVETVAALAVRLGKVPVVTRDAPGFLVNRVLGPCLNEAGHLLSEGWDALAVDRAWKRFGMPMGPFRLIDEIGIDVMSHAGEAMAQQFGERMAPAAALVALAISGRPGRKGDKGFYRYEGGREKGFDQTVYADMKLSGTRSTPDQGRVQDRLVFAMVNEAARVLEEQVVGSAADVDLGMVMGTGFPPFRGGLLKYADDRGPAEVLRSLEVLEVTYGHRFAPSPLVRELGESGETFHGAFPAGRE